MNKNLLLKKQITTEKMKNVCISIKNKKENSLGVFHSLLCFSGRNDKVFWISSSYSTVSQAILTTEC